jgi:small ligand-binding sensory domain FIST
VHGDFLVRGLIGADPDDGTIAVGAGVRPGQVVRLHARDADSADRDLREALGLRRTALGGQSPAARSCSPATAAGAGCSASATTTPRRSATSSTTCRRPGSSRRARSGPVGGETFMHGFTATVALFPR